MTTFTGPISTLAGLAALQAETLGSPDVCVAVLDGPVDLAHPAFRGASVTTLDTPVSSDEAADRTHGTHVASLVFGQPGSAVPGVAPRSKGLVIPVHAFGPDMSLAAGNPPDLARGIRQALDHGAHVVTLHGGALSPDAGMLDALAKALARAAERNVLVVVAAEGDGGEHFHVPTAASTVLAVAAEDSEGKLLDFGMWGPTYRDSGIIVPGEGLVGAAPGGGTVAQSGATFAAAMVAGIAALFLAAQQAQGKTPDPRAVRSALLQSATPHKAAEGDRAKGVLRGRINVEGAAQILRG
ncbi:S8 family serine peptidase [Polyangium aurulentum]|uniref:S8 family serine peptidase n=1 Tax=Polyangium aurulentum TaxID=2567896 RepID=UPI0010AED0BA|nr:S8 family serine peptidase [Polyangium aurulentum]UQA54929.1 S8 family serine peptidase [Polyangium aurulentum]